MILKRGPAQLFFELEGSKLAMIHQQGGMGEYLRILENDAMCMFESLNGSWRSLICMDEGVPKKPCDAGAAGAMVWLAHQPRGYLKVVKYCRDAHIGQIFSHDGCGAMRRLFAQLHYEGAIARLGTQGDALAALKKESEDVSTHLPLSELNAFSKRMARRLAEKLSNDLGWVVHHGHHLEKKLRRPDFHIGRVVYYVGTKAGFSPLRRAHYMPIGYLVSRCWYSEVQDAVNDVQLALDIALNPQSYGHFVDDLNPLYVIAIGDAGHPQLNAAQLCQELAYLPAMYDNKVRVDCFSYPFA